MYCALYKSNCICLTQTHPEKQIKCVWKALESYLMSQAHSNSRIDENTNFNLTKVTFFNLQWSHKSVDLNDKETETAECWDSAGSELPLLNEGSSWWGYHKWAWWSTRTAVLCAAHHTQGFMSTSLTKLGTVHLWTCYFIVLHFPQYN